MSPGGSGGTARYFCLRPKWKIPPEARSGEHQDVSNWVPSAETLVLLLLLHDVSLLSSFLLRFNVRGRLDQQARQLDMASELSPDILGLTLGQTISCRVACVLTDDKPFLPIATLIFDLKSFGTLHSTAQEGHTNTSVSFGSQTS